MIEIRLALGLKFVRVSCSECKRISVHDVKDVDDDCYSY